MQGSGNNRVTIILQKVASSSPQPPFIEHLSPSIDSSSSHMTKMPVSSSSRFSSTGRHRTSTAGPSAPRRHSIGFPGGPPAPVPSRPSSYRRPIFMPLTTAATAAVRGRTRGEDEERSRTRLADDISWTSKYLSTEHQPTGRNIFLSVLLPVYRNKSN